MRAPASTPAIASPAVPAADGRIRRTGLWLCAATGAAALVVGLVGGAPAPVVAGPVPVAAPAPAAVGAKIKPWHLAASLVALRAEIDARWPRRDRASDGAIGDARHSKTRNSHNPVGTKRGPEHGTKGAVHALDITAAGIDTDVVVHSLIGDPRVWYVIFDGRIWSRTTGWAARAQVGDAHTTHIHVSLRDGTERIARAAESDTSRWLARPAGSSRSGKLGTRATKALQKALIRQGYRTPSGATGWYGPETTKAVRAFQRDQGWSGSGADGIAGSTTLDRLGIEGGTTKAARDKAAAKKAAAEAAAAKADADKTSSGSSSSGSSSSSD